MSDTNINTNTNAVNRAVTDYTDQLAESSYNEGRAGLPIVCAVLHTTAGPGDTNSASLAQAQAREQATINWFLSGGASVHYMVGPEITGAKIYRLCREDDTAWHAAGKPVRNIFVAPNGTRLEGSLEGSSKVNRGSIGIERWGRVGEPIGEKQKTSMVALVVDIALRYSLKPEQIVSHAYLQTDRSDGNELLAECRAAVAALWSNSNPDPAPVANLPFGAKLTREGWLTFAGTGKTVKGAILDYFLRFAGALPAPSLADYPERVFRSVHVFGLPLTDEFTDGAKVLQRFEQATLVYDPAQPDGWKVRPLRVAAA